MTDLTGELSVREGGPAEKSESVDQILFNIQLKSCQGPPLERKKFWGELKDGRSAEQAALDRHQLKKHFERH
jgi:hypothetical protein